MCLVLKTHEMLNINKPYISIQNLISAKRKLPIVDLK